jgi:hypothetical protein
MTMKTGVATLLSLAGVLVAGSAAALVNARVLQASDPVAGSAAESITTGSIVTQPGTVPEPSATQALYRVGDAGTVLLDTGGGVLTVVAVTPAAQWAVVIVESTGDQVSVVLRSETHIATFAASLVGGVVATDVDIDQVQPETGPGVVPGTAPGGTRPSTTVDHDHNDDDDDQPDETDETDETDDPDEPDDDDD